jgi:hypothetical protein
MRRLTLGLVIAAAVLAPAAVCWAEIVTYDVVDGLFANIPAGATGGPAAQSGIDNWWYKYEPVTRFNQRDSLIERDPSTFLLMELGSDGTARPYGWAADHGYAINDRGVFRNGSIANRMVRGGTAQGDGVWGNAENNAQIALEWVAPSDGTADAYYELIGRNHANTDIEWHLATSTGADPWNDLDFIAVTQAHTPAFPAVLEAVGLDLAAGESIYLYGQIYDFDDWDGTVITGGITFTTQPAELIPEPATATLALLGMVALGGWLLVVRRSRAP